MGPHHLRSIGRRPRGVRRIPAAHAFAAALLLATLVASPAPAAIAPAAPSPLALATLSPAEPRVLGTSFLSRIVPSPYQMYSPCFDGSPTRLHGPHGLVIIPTSAEPEEDGVHWVIAPGPGGEPGSSGVLTWRDYRDVDLWKPGGPGSGRDMGYSLGMVVGAAVVIAAVPKPTSLSAILVYPVEIIAIGIASAGIGALIGERVGPPDKGHWVRCNR